MHEYGTRIILQDLDCIGEVDRCYPEDKEYRIVFNGVKFNIPEVGFNAIFAKHIPSAKQDVIEIPSKPMATETEHVVNIEKLKEPEIKKKGWFGL